MNAKIIGNNLYAYCFDNPLVYSDKRGTLPPPGMVYAYGDAYESDAGVTRSIITGMCYDSYGNEAEFVTFVGISNEFTEEIPTGIAGVGYSATGVVQHYNADDVYDIAGIGSYAGGSVDVGFSIGFDLIVLGKTVAEVVRTNADADGWQVSVGIGLGINWVHEGNAYMVIRLIKEKGIGIPEEMRKWVDKKPEHGIMEF